jgi:hypothetical protein
MDRLNGQEAMPGGPRRLSVEEMQAALTAAWRGEFAASAAGSVRQPTAAAANGAGDGRNGSTRVTTSAGRVPATRTQPRRGTGRVAAVLAAHSGAGASTVAVAIADALASAGERVRLVDAADPRRSGLVSASGIELGETGEWRRGRRTAGGGQIQVERLAGCAAELGSVPPPRQRAMDGGWLVLDVGWPAWDIVGVAGWVAEVLAAARPVLVCRPTVPGLRQTEQILGELPGAANAIVACVGSTRWPRQVGAGCGPRLAEIRAAGRLLSVPVRPALAANGVTADPLPKAAAVAGHVLAALLADGTGSSRTSGVSSW